ncbi:hypothetical protein [Paenibacillus agricola]|uniref:Tail assembly chaperone n=1 Tax=Paenibacillus agricola TaxID=2716264 RepID=A0ABX0J5F0_9BACL|nr:hypothetical protein [Paenibacillus agricola]NHN31193.1 hypothetical protein [Paenibacillus agricola]
MTTKLNVSLTQSFRLTSDGERSLIVQERHMVDPAKAPGFSARLAADPTLSTEPHEDWRNIGYYGMTAAGLNAALQDVVLRQAVIDSGSDTMKTVQSLGELAQIIRGHSERLREAVEGIVLKSDEKAAV